MTGAVTSALLLIETGLNKLSVVAVVVTGLFTLISLALFKGK
jgi:uncharacterized membrane protein YoaK (UPF0700 family)